MLKTRSQIQPLVFRDVTIIDVTDAIPKTDMTIVISGGRIVDICKTQVVRIPKNAQVIDVTGKFLILVCGYALAFAHGTRDTHNELGTIERGKFANFGVARSQSAR